MATWPTITDDDGSNTTGTVVDNTNVWNPIRDYIGGAWSSVAFSAGNFTGGGSQTWTLTSGDQDTFRYVEVGKTMIVQVVLLTTSVGGTAHPELRLTIPNGRTMASTSSGLFWGLNNSANCYGCWQAVSGETFIRLYVDPSAATNWNNPASNTTQIRGTFVLHIA